MTAELVIDASVALAWCFQDEATSVTRELLRGMADARAAVPSLWFFEVANALAVAERRGRIASALANGFLELIAGFDLEVHDDAEEWAFTSVLALARAHGLTAYDAAYLDLAFRRRLPLATLDRRLSQAATARGVQVLGT